MIGRHSFLFYHVLCLGRRIAAEWLARRTLKSQVPGSIPGSGKAHVEWKGYSITKQKPSSARGSFVSFSANSKLAPILGHARRFIRRLRHILNIVHELIIRCEEGNKIIILLYAFHLWNGINLGYFSLNLSRSSISSSECFNCWTQVFLLHNNLLLLQQNLLLFVCGW